ncbi:MAG: FkbM family methyltransferase [Opitutaceae bacterium]|nr:FkbM family methyltransferase [Verrucomicrobiales bacterium]
MVAKAIKRLLPYSSKVWLREKILGLYGIPFSRHDIPGPLVKRFRGATKVCLVDIGASSGDFTENFGRFCNVRQALLIEPIPKRCDQLKARFARSGFRIVCGAVGDKDAELQMEVLKWDYSSSILPVLRSDPNVASEIDLDVAETISTRVRTLDQIWTDTGMIGPVDLLKIDVQGAEHLVLDGARETLKQVRAIWIEVSFRPLYEGSLTFEGINQRCRSAGFILTSLTEGFRGANGELLQGDALFVRAGQSVST